MPKRYTDTDKWEDPWFSELDNDSKIIWFYLLDRCNHAGIWKINFKHLKYFCNTDKTEDEIREVFAGRFYEFDDKWFFPKFLKFQYPKGLHSNKPAIISVRNCLLSYNLSEIINQLLPNNYDIVKDIYKDKDNTKTKIRKPDSEQIKRILETDYDDPKYVPKPE